MIHESRVSKTDSNAVLEDANQAPDTSLLLEYVRSCCELTLDNGCDVSAIVAEDGAIHVDCKITSGVWTDLSSVEATHSSMSHAAYQQACTGYLEALMDWFTTALMDTTCSATEEVEEDEEAEFIELGRSILHTKAVNVRTHVSRSQHAAA